MKRRTGQPTTNPPIHAATRKLVATRHAFGLRHKRSEYDSSDRLPDIDSLLDRTAQEIQRIHLVRKRSQKTFDRLWEQVCEKLAELGNASAYARWKQDHITRNLDQFQKLDVAAAEAWAASLTPLNPDVGSAGSVLDDMQFQRLREERSGLKSEIEISIDSVLEVAIAYWIEAMNARNDGDELRAMHALIPCQFHLGMAHALRMTHDAKADDARQSGQKERDALAEVVLNVMQDFIVAKSIHNQDLLLESITHAIEDDPAHAEVLHAYDARVSERTKDSIGTRFPTTLKTWVTGKKPLYPRLAPQFQKLARQITKKPGTRNVVRRKANG